MSPNKCPHCGEYVQKNSLTCPKCFREIPREPDDRSEYIIREDEKSKRRKVPRVAVMLSIFPPFVGLLGIGMIYLNYRERKGYWFLLAGLLIFLSVLALFFLISGASLLSDIMRLAAIAILLLIYASAAFAAFFETMFGSVFKALRI